MTLKAESSTRHLLLIRHCQASGQAPEAPLTARGWEQAQKLALFLAALPVDQIVSSTYVRAQQTITPFATRTALPVRLDERLIERRLAPAPVDNWREVIRDSFADLNLRLPGGESGHEVRHRGWAALHALWAHTTSLGIAVTHGALLSLILNSLDPAFGYNQWEALSNPDIFRLQQDDHGRWQFEHIEP